MRNMELVLFDVNGKSWELNNPRSPVRIVRGGRPDLYARGVATMWAGEVTRGRSKVVGYTDTLRVGFYPTRSHDLNKVRREFRAGWANDQYCELRARHTPDGTWATARLRLPDDQGLPPRDVLTPQVFDTLDVPVAWDDGYWRVPMRGKGATVEVFNPGVTRVKVWAVWKTGGTLTLPSGARLSLPTVAETRRVLLDRRKGFPVTALDGTPDRVLQKRLWGQMVEERVMPNTTGVFKPTPGGWLEWELGVPEP